MHSFLIIPGNEDLIKEKARGRVLEFPITKISDVRELARFTNLKLTEKTTILIRDFDEATEAAQNAILKALEEPQENLVYILTAKNTENVLPTIISRCEVLEFSNFKLQITNEEKEKTEKFLGAEIGEKLKIISKITKRDEAKEFINNLIIVGHELMIKNPNNNLQNMLEAGMKTLKNLEMNGNVGLQLTNLIIKIV